MSHHRLFAQLAFERALGMAALNALAQAVAECDQFRAVGRERDPIHFWVLAGELEDVVQDRIRDVLDGPGLAVVERGELFHQPRIVELVRSEEHTSELQSLMRISYAVFCLKKKKKNTT